MEYRPQLGCQNAWLIEHRQTPADFALEEILVNFFLLDLGLEHDGKIATTLDHLDNCVIRGCDSQLLYKQTDC